MKENERVKEALMQEEEKKQNVLSAADTGESGQKYKQLEFLLQVNHPRGVYGER